MSSEARYILGHVGAMADAHQTTVPAELLIRTATSAWLQHDEQIQAACLHCVCERCAAGKHKIVVGGSSTVERAGLCCLIKIYKGLHATK